MLEVVLGWKMTLILGVIEFMVLSFPVITSILISLYVLARIGF